MTREIDKITWPKSRNLQADRLTEDPRIAQAKHLLIDTVIEHSSKLQGTRPPDPALKQSYEKTLSMFAEYRGGSLWFPYLGSGLGNGALVELLDGSVKIDFISGIGPHFFGHSHPELIAASFDASLSDLVIQGNLQQNADSMELSKILLEVSGMDHCFLTTTGAMANENALKIAFQKKHPAHRVLAFERCFTGRTLAMSQITDKPGFREGLPCNLFVDYIPYYEPENPRDSTEKSISTLKNHLKRYPNSHAAMIFEMVQGEGGFYSGTTEYFKSLMNVLKENGIAIFIDEVQTFGRTPQIFAYQYFGLESYVDIVSIGKLSHVCATLFKDKYRPKPGLLSQTFTGSTSAIRCAKVIVEKLLNEGFYGKEGRIEQIHQQFVKGLKAIENRHPHLIKGPYGIGAMVAFTPFDGEAPKTNAFVRSLFDAGVISFVAGSNPARVRFLPPAGILQDKDISEALNIVEETLKRCTSSDRSA